MEAPKILWYDDQECAAGPVQFNSDEVKYVRADLVNGLVEALEAISALDKTEEDEWDGVHRVMPLMVSMARTALKALESAEIGRWME
jgi:hypothetical protein